MNNKFKRLFFIWLGLGLILTSCLYFYQKDHNDGKVFSSKITKHRPSYVKHISEKVRTYYEYAGVLTVGGALVILGLGFKEKK